MSTGRLVAEVRYGPTAHIRAFKRGNCWWFAIRLGKKRMLTCDCGGAVKHMPNEMTYDESWGGCSHIVALFKGNVTQDKRVATSGDYRITANGNMPIFFVRLTELGERMFFHLWVALKL